MSGGEDQLPLPSQLRCIVERTDRENLFEIYQAVIDLEPSRELPTPSPTLMADWDELAAAQEACGFPIPLGPATMTLIDCNDERFTADIIELSNRDTSGPSILKIYDGATVLDRTPQLLRCRAEAKLSRGGDVFIIYRTFLDRDGDSFIGYRVDN